MATISTGWRERGDIQRQSLYIPKVQGSDSTALRGAHVSEARHYAKRWGPVDKGTAVPASSCDGVGFVPGVEGVEGWAWGRGRRWVSRNGNVSRTALNIRRPRPPVASPEVEALACVDVARDTFVPALGSLLLRSTMGAPLPTRARNAILPGARKLCQAADGDVGRFRRPLFRAGSGKVPLKTVASLEGGGRGLGV